MIRPGFIAGFISWLLRLFGQKTGHDVLKVAMHQLIERTTCGETPDEAQVFRWIWEQKDASPLSRLWAEFLLNAVAQTHGMLGFSEFMQAENWTAKDLRAFAYKVCMFADDLHHKPSVGADDKK